MRQNDVDMILKVYGKLSKEQEQNDALKFTEYLENTEDAGKKIWPVFDPFYVIKLHKNGYKYVWGRGSDG